MSPTLARYKQLVDEFPRGSRVEIMYSNGRPTGRTGTVIKVGQPTAGTAANEIKVGFEDGTHDWILPYLLKRLHRRRS